MTTTEHAFVFADLAGYTALTEVHGDESAADLAIRFHALAHTCLPPRTRIVKTIGDAVMLVAPTIEGAIVAALALTTAVHAQPSFPALRVGVHAGPAVERDGDFFGAAVNVAARVAAVARSGEIACTDVVAIVAVRRGLAAACPLGTFRLKNVAAPLSLFRLQTDGPTGPLRHVDPVCRMQVRPEEADTVLEHQGTTLYFCSARCAVAFRLDPERHLPAG